MAYDGAKSAATSRKNLQHPQAKCAVVAGNAAGDRDAQIFTVQVGQRNASERYWIDKTTGLPFRKERLEGGEVKGVVLFDYKNVQPPK